MSNDRTKATRWRAPAAHGQLRVERGSPLPLGATADPGGGGVNFCVFSQHATAVWLLLFAEADAPDPFQEIALSRTRFYWHALVVGAAEGLFYAFRADRSHDTSIDGARFDRQKALIDPYARGNYDGLWVEAAARSAGDNVRSCIRSCVIDPGAYDWEDDRPPRTAMKDTIIYEAHVRGFTRSATSGCRAPGVFRGLIEKAPYIALLGVTAVQLLPIFDFDGKTQKRTDPTTGAPLYNFWGYDPYSFFAPNSDYCSTPQLGAHLDELRDLVKAMHRQGIEIILDVVFNHSGEGNENGPTIGLKGFDNSVYYYLQSDKGKYLDLTGAGNTLNAEHPVFAAMVRDSLRFWVEQMHVDGFRFDLGSLLAVRSSRETMDFPPVVWAIDLESSLAETKLIVEPLGDTIGHFPETAWSTWNWRLKNTFRRFVRGERGIVGDVATCLAGSSDIFSREGQGPIQSVSYVACHDGMTLQDLVCYSVKHNERNGEDSGGGDDLSCNYGVEGPTNDAAITKLRRKQVKNFLAMLLLSQGVPMLMAGDEFGRTQQGNNNAWDQDNEVSWLDWSEAATDSERLRFTRAMIAFRKRTTALRRSSFFTGRIGPRGLPDIEWHGCRLGSPGWSDPRSGVLACTLSGDGDEPDLHLMFNMENQPLSFDLPVIDARRWFRTIDTELASPNDAADLGAEVEVTRANYIVNGQSICVLMTKRAAAP